jgi:hypothetical protein
MCSLALVSIRRPTLTVSHRHVFKATIWLTLLPACERHLYSQFESRDEAHIPIVTTDSRMPHQNFKLSMSTSTPTLARVCALTFPEDSRVSHALTILHLRPRPLCRRCISAPSPTCSPPSRPILVVPSLARCLHTFRYPISSPRPDTQQAIHG